MYIMYLFLLSLISLATANDRTFTIALHPNKIGVRTLEYMILKHYSNVNSKYYGQYKSIDEINQLVQTPKYQRQEILAWLSLNGITNCQDLYDAIKCTTTKNNINQVTNVIPTHLQKYVVFIEGLDTKVNKLRKHRVRPWTKSSAIVDPGLVTREVLMRLYNLSNTKTGKKVSVGAMEYQGGNGFSNKNLNVSQFYNGVNTNAISSDHILGTNSEMPDTESQLDVQVMYWAASDATLWYEDYKGPKDNGWLYSWANNFMNRKEVPQVVSLSWGWSEVQQCRIGMCPNGTDSQAYVERTNLEFMKIVARGVTMVVASGDAGSPGRTNELCESVKQPTGWNNMNAIFPGSSPWVLSVGATFIVRDKQNYNFTTPICQNKSTTPTSCATGTEERGTTYTETGWTSGSGFTRWYPSPKWQQLLLQNYLNSGVTLPNRKFFNATNRAYPDVSAFGHNCAVYGSYLGWGPVDGSSCASPIFAGIITHLNAYQLSKGRPLLGFVNPLLYKLYDTNSKTFHDIVVGNSSCTESMCCGPDFGFLATKGWDPVSGLGTPNVSEMKKELDKLFIY